MALLTVLAACLVAGLITARAQAASRGIPAAVVRSSMTRVTVLPGQTLWGIALRARPAADPRVVIQQIMDVNGLRDSSLQPGDQLWVPRG